MNPAQLLAHFDRISEAPDVIPRLRRFILELAVRGKLVDQDLNDEPASYLLMRIQSENRQLGNTFHPLAEDEQPFTIPQSWAWIRLGNAAHVEMGQSPPSENYNQSGDGIPFYQGKTDFGLRHPTPRYWCDLPSKIAQKNDILISVRAPVGPTNVASEECCIGRGLAALRPHYGVYLEFLLCSLKGFESAIAAMGYGTTFVAITKKQLVSFAVPLPPLAEQHRIVAKVEVLMTLCDRLEAAQAERESRRDCLAASSLNRLNNGADPDTFRNHARLYFNHLPRLTTRPEQVQQLRQTILNLAVRGKLVSQDRNDKPVSKALEELKVEKMRMVTTGFLKFEKPLEAIKQEEEPFVLPEGWGWRKIDSLVMSLRNDIRTGPFGSALHKQDHRLSGIPVWGIESISKKGSFTGKNKIFLDSDKALELSAFAVKGGDIIVARSGTVGDLCRLPDDAPHGLLSTNLMKISLNRQIVSPDYFCLLFKGTKSIDMQLAELCSGSTRLFLTQAILAKLFFPLPPLAEQQRIIAKVDELMALCDRLETQLTTTQTESRRFLEAVIHEALAPAV